MGRILAMDYGTKRVGVAVTDPLQLIASALATVPASEILPWLKNYLSKETVDAFVVGDPKNLDGTPTHASAPVENFIRILNKNFPDIPVNKIDESFTSKIAVQTLVQANYKKRVRQEKGNLDKVSATLILQTYLETAGK